MATNKTGYIYAWGEGNDFENYVPNLVTGLLASGISAGPDYNLAILLEPTPTPPPPTPTPTPVPPPTPTPTWGYTFEIFNTSKKDCVNELEFISTYSSGSGEFLKNSIAANINKGQIGTEYNRAFIAMGQTLKDRSDWYENIQSGLISYWQLNESSTGNRTNSISENFTLIQTGNVPAYGGLMDHGAGFISQSRLNYLNAKDVSVGPSYSVSFWFNLRNITGVDTFSCPWTLGTSGNNKQSLFLSHLNNTTVRGWVYDEASSSLVGDFSGVATGQWNNVILTCQSGYGLELYFNTKFIAAYTDGWMVNRYSNGFGIGGYINTDDTMVNPFSGVVDEVAIWNRAISQSDINNIYNFRLGNNLLYVDRYKYPTDTTIEVYKNLIPYKSGDSWLDFNSEFQELNYTNIPTGDAGVVIKDYTQNSYYDVNYGIKDTFGQNDLVRQGIKLKNLKFIPPTYSILSSDSKVWASYDISTRSGMESGSQNVFSYALEIIRDMAADAIVIDTGFKEEDALNFTKGLKSPLLKQGIGSWFNLYSGFCLDDVECGIKTPPPSIDICYTGATTGIAYVEFISGIRKAFKNEPFVKKYDGNASATRISTKLQSGSDFVIKTGEIKYNTFVSGDRLAFNLYAYDYTGLYKQYHLNNNPIYPTTGFSLLYPRDFNSIDSLVAVLNNNLNKPYPVWFPHKCISGESMGIYISGNLMFFEKLTGIQYSGTEDFNNIIKFNSLVNYESGLDFNLSLVNRDKTYSENLAKSFKNGFSYLIPDIIELQGQTSGLRSSGDKWLVLDRRTGLYKDLTGLKPEVVQLPLNKKNFISSGQGVVPSSQINPVIYSGEKIVIMDNIITGGFQTVLDITQITTTPGSPYCGGPTRNERTIKVKVPTGWASGVNGCSGVKEVSLCAVYGKKLKLNLADECSDKCIENGGVCVPYQFPDTECYLCSGLELSGDAGRAKDREDFYLNVLRTGWNLDPTGIYLNCWLSNNNYDITALNFDRYRIVAKNFSGVIPKAGKDYLVPKNEIYFKNFNLFSAVKTEIPSHTGPSMCLVGADYVADINDIRPLKFIANYNYSITGEDMSGIYRAFNEAISYTPIGNEAVVKFINKTGKFVGDVTGFLTRNFTGSGIISQVFDGYYFYNTGTKEVTFEKIYTGDFPNGSGFLTGVEYAIKRSVIDRATSVGGIFTNNSFYITGNTSGEFKSLITGVDYMQTGLTGYFYITGITGGLSSNGYYNNSFIPIESGEYIDQSNYPYYPFVTGLIQSTGIINVDTSKLINFNYISINNKIVSYNSDTINYLAPDFFNSRDGLVNIINTNSVVFGCTGYALNSSGIILISTLSGTSGNFIALSSSGSGISIPNPNLLGGETYYLRMYPSTNFSGFVNVSFASTGFYSGYGSGNITGNINQYTGIRNFTGVWDIQTGVNSNFVSFKDSNFLSGSNYYSNIISDSIGKRSAVLQSRVFYTNELNTLDIEEVDVADVVISGNNFGPSGSGVAFRLIAVKNL